MHHHCFGPFKHLSPHSFPIRCAPNAKSDIEVSIASAKQLRSLWMSHDAISTYPTLTTPPRQQELYEQPTVYQPCCGR